MLYGEGISREGDLLDLAVNNNIVEKSGSWFSYKGERIGQGRENARAFLKENKDTLAKMDAEVRKTLGLGAVSRPGRQPRKPQPHLQAGKSRPCPQGAGSGKNSGGQTVSSWRDGRPARPSSHSIATPFRTAYNRGLHLTEAP